MAQEIADSTLLNTWGSSGLIIEPDISKIIEGWQLGEQPPHEYMNWLQNTFGSKLNHILKNGVASWNNETEYEAGASVQHSGNVWLCKATNTNSEPTELNNNWAKIPSLENLPLTVDTIEDFPTGATTGNTCIVKDLDRGGIFVYDSTKVSEDNQGTNFNGWIRQYSGAINVKWSGAKGDGVTDDTLALIRCNSILNSNTTLLFPSGIYLISKDGFSDFTDTFGNKVLNIENKRNISIIGERATIKIVNHDITNYGGLLFLKHKNVNNLRILGFDFDMTFTGYKDSSLFYPSCGAIEGEDLSTLSGQDPNVLNGDMIIADCTFKIYHPLGSFKRTNNPYNGDDNNGFKIYSCTFFGVNGALGFNDGSRNFSASNIIFKDGHNAYGLWAWATNNVSFDKITAENWVSKATNADNSISKGIPLLRYQQFKASNLSITNCFFRAKPSSERIVSGFEGSSEFLDAADNLVSSSTTNYGSVLVSGNTIINGHGDDANTIYDYLLEIETSGTINIYGNNFDGHSDSGNRYLPDPAVNVIANTVIYCDFSKDNAANGVSFINISGNEFGENCKANNILIENSHDTDALRKCKTAIIMGNTSYSKNNYFFANSRLNTYSSNGISNLTISNNIIDGANDAITSASIYSRGLFLVSSASDVITISNNDCSNMNTFINDVSVNASTKVSSYSNQITNVTTYRTSKADSFTVGNALNNNNKIQALSNNGSIVEARTPASYIALLAQTSLTSITTDKVMNLYGEGVSSMQVRGTGINPSTDNNKTLGAPSYKWSTIYAGTGTINTSDDREKVYFDITDVEKQVALELKENMRKFKFNDSISEKGEEKARIHFGASAQTVKSIFEKYGLVAEDYAILCYDEWEEQEEIKDNNGVILQEYRPAGNRYGLRYEELLSFIIGAL